MGYYVVVDLEMCKVRKAGRKRGYGYGSEIIQIGAVLLNEGFEAVDEYSTYVSPEYGCIDSFISRLTNIGKKDGQ